jgi:hypothetical protein
LSAKDWAKKLAKRQKLREKELAKKKKELEDADKAVYGESKSSAARYSSYLADVAGDLAGLKVGHGAEDFETGEDVILTLKDSKVMSFRTSTLPKTRPSRLRRRERERPRPNTRVSTTRNSTRTGSARRQMSWANTTTGSLLVESRPRYVRLIRDCGRRADVP